MNGIVEAMARAMCEASGDEWRTGTYSLSTGPNFEWENHSADPLNNHWRHKALAALKALHEVEFDGPLNDASWAMTKGLQEHGTVAAAHFNHMKPILRAAIQKYFDAAIQEHSTPPKATGAS